MPSPDVVFALTGDVRRNSRALKQLRALAALGATVEVLTFGPPADDPSLEEGIRLRVLHRPPGSGPRFFARAHRLFAQTAGQLSARVYHASDLYTLPALHTAARRHGGRLVYDARELYPYVASTARRPWARGVWRFVEGRHIRHADAVFTVSHSIADRLAQPEDDWKPFFRPDVTHVRGLKRPPEARAAAAAIRGMDIGGHRVERLLVEERAAIAREYYAAVLNDPPSKGPLVLFSTLGGMDIEDAARTDPARVRRATVDIRAGFDRAAAQRMLEGLDLGDEAAAVADVLVRLYAAYRGNDAELLEINPLAVTEAGGLVALDCKFTLDDSGVKRQPGIAPRGTPERLTGLEARGQELGLRYIELDGNVGVLANGAGLTMTTMDVVRHHGGRPANFLEIGGEAYTQAKPALELVLSDPGVKSIVINFCGAFARTDVMVEGVIDALDELEPTVGMFFCVHGTGEKEAVAMLKRRLGVEPFDTMDEAIQAAVEAAR